MTKATDQTPDLTDEVAEKQLNSVLNRALSNFKGTFFFERMISYGDFNNAKFGISVQFDYAPDATPEEFFEAARLAAYQAKALVGQEAKLKFERDEEGTLHEVLQAFPGAAVVSDSESIAPASDVPDSPPYDPAEIKKLPKGDEKTAQYNANSAWAEARYNAGFQREFWDNRGDKKYPNSHDFAHKTHKGVGFWLNDD